MRTKWKALAVALIAGATLSAAGAAQAQDHRGGRHYDGRHYDWRGGYRDYGYRGGWGYDAWSRERARRIWLCEYRGICGPPYAYYGPPAPYYYGQPGVSLDFNFR